MGTLKTLKVSEYRTIDALLGGSDDKPSKLQRIKYIHLIAYINIRKSATYIHLHICHKKYMVSQNIRKINYALSTYTVSFPNFTLQLVALSGLHLEKGMCSKEIENRLLFPS